MSGYETNHHSELTNDDIRQLLAPTAEPTQHIKGLLALGLTREDLFSVLDVTENDMGLVLDEDIGRAKELLGEGDYARTVLLQWGVSEEDLGDGVAVYLAEHSIEHNTETIDRFGDPKFLAQRGQRILDDVRKTAEILMDDGTNRPYIQAWLLAPDPECEGLRRIDGLKTDPVRIQAGAHAAIIADEGERLPDIYGQG